jgi:hypothetical protein
MPTNILKKDSPRGKGPQPSSLAQDDASHLASTEEKLKESDLAAKEEQQAWESQEVGITRWSETDGQRYGD